MWQRLFLQRLDRGGIHGPPVCANRVWKDSLHALTYRKLNNANVVPNRIDIVGHYLLE